MTVDPATALSALSLNGASGSQGHREPAAAQKKGPIMPPASVVKAFNHFWIDTHVEDLPSKISFELYPQPTRGLGAQGSYLVTLPPGYKEDSEERYPVLYWLHGGMGTQRQAQWALEFYRNAMEEGRMPKTIVVSVQALPVGWYANSLDGERPIATIVSKDLVQAIDQRYKTVRHPSGRWIEGFSMGGYGTLHLGFSYPEIFGVLSSIAGALLPSLSQEPPQRVVDTFGTSQAYYDNCHPYYLLEANGSRLNDTVVRLLSGSDDVRLTEAIARMSKRMSSLGMDHKAVEVKDVDHAYEAILEGTGQYATEFWQAAAARIVKA